MIAADTNVLVRIVTNDEPELAARAIDFFRQQEAVFIPKTVLLELEWVLRGGYRLPRQAVLAAIGAILRLPNVEIEDVETAYQAVEWCSKGLDFAAAHHLASAGRGRAFITFDTRLQRAARRLAIEGVTGLPG